MFLFCALGSSIRCLMIFTLPYLFNPCSMYKIIECLKVCNPPIRNGMPLRSMFTTEQVVIGALISATLSDCLGHVFVTMDDLTNDGFSTIKDTNLILRNSIDLNTDALLYRQIRHKLLNLDIPQLYIVFYRISDDKAISITNLKRSLNKSLAPGISYSITIFNQLNIPKMDTGMDYPAFTNELRLSKNNPTLEHYTYGFMNTLLIHAFSYIQGFAVIPQSGQTSGIVDFFIKKDGITIGICECKAEKSKYSWTDLYTQAIDYANTNVDSEVCYVIINKGHYLLLGIFS